MASNDNFQILKMNLFSQLLKKNQQESEPFDDIINSYNDLYSKCLSLKEKLKLVEKSSTQLQIISADQNISEERLKIISLEKELNDVIKENSQKSARLCEVLTDQMIMKDQIENLKQQVSNKSARASELEQIVKWQDEQLKKLSDDNMFLKTENARLEKANFTLNETLNKKLVENTVLTNEILTIKEDMIQKMNDMNEMLEAARKKKEAANLYFDEKQLNFRKSNEAVNLLESVKDFQCEDVNIPKTLKMKFCAHKKGITSLKCNNFGTHYLTTGSDNFVKMWDASKNMEAAVFSGFTSAVSSASFDHTEQNLFAGSMDKTAKLWSLKNNKLQGTFTGHIDYINCVQSYYSVLKGLTGSSDRTIKEWDFNTLKLSRNFSCVSSCNCLGMSFDDSFIVSGHLDGTLKVWSSNDKPEHIIDLHDDKILHVELIKNENQILSISKDYSIKLYDLRKMETVYIINDEILPQYCESNLSISSDKKYFSVGSTKGQVYVFNTSTGKLEDTIDNKSPGSILAIQWRPYHSQLYVGDSLGFLSIWGAN